MSILISFALGFLTGVGLMFLWGSYTERQMLDEIEREIVKREGPSVKYPRHVN